MLQTDVRDHGDLGRVDDVGAVQRPAHADLQHDDIACLPRVIRHGDRGHELKLAGMILHPVGDPAHVVRNLRERVFGDVFAVDPDALTERLDIRRGVKPGAVSRACQDGREHRAGAAFPVASGDVDEAQLFLRIAHPVQQGAGPVQSETRRAPGAGFDIGNSVFCVHAAALFSWSGILGFLLFIYYGKPSFVNSDFAKLE